MKQKIVLIASVLMLALSGVLPAHGQWVQVFNSLQYNDDGSLAAAGDTLYLHTMFKSIFRSTDHGITWTATDGTVTDTLPDLYTRLGLWLFKFDSIKGIIKSNDGGKNWSSSFSGGFGIVSNGSILYSTNGYGKLFLSKDTGQNWDSVLQKDSVPVYNLAASGSLLFDAFGDYEGEVYYSTDLGITWNHTGTMHRVNNIIISGGNIVVSTTNTGLWWALLIDFESINSTVSNKTADNSFSAYPNPFSQSTTITFSSPESGVTELSIVNLLGTQVARLFEGELSAGEHTFTWNASGMPPGTYWATLRMNGSMNQVPIVLQEKP